MSVIAITARRLRLHRHAGARRTGRAFEHYRGHLQADAYVAYDAFFTKPKRGMVEVGCWAHARRHFHQALETDPSRMRTVLLLIAQLYGIERTARERSLYGEG